jgi:hypothetical protein
MPEFADTIAAAYAVEDASVDLGRGVFGMLRKSL